ncbi:uncharacterized protein LOC135463663 isoform X7 [Liolophura sinensis]|uniref:uncharacterized protein LOC135463663 isoform X7 n=1 Tax=Liolophura sinensis TaxID=3198878 RepID=UPI00315936B6
MGVTLERVQNKFACIIGELCNEPYVLSQFAIWVDLRIAEYKAKGSIALDCTGNIPEPTWLKGLNPPAPIQSDLPLHRGLTTVRSKSPRHKRHGLGHSPTAMLHPTSDTSHLQERDTGDSDILELVVKNEPQEVFPVSLHVHDRLSADRTNSRKRASAQDQDVLHSDNSIFPTSASTPSKSRRLSSHSDNSFSAGGQDSVSNQSFLSVIGIGEQPSTSSISDQAGDALLTVQRYEASQISEEDQSVGADPSISTSSQSAHLLDNVWTASSAPQKTVSTLRNSASALGICQRWLADHCGEHRKIETIEPSALDPLLSRFITEVKRYGGRDYHPNSLVSLRKCLDRHLRLNFYPCSIKDSPEFYNFQEAFRLRKAELELKLAQGVISPGVNRITREDVRSGAI